MIRILRFAGLYVETLLTFTQTQLHTPPIALPSPSSFHQLTHTQSHILIIWGLDGIHLFSTTQHKFLAVVSIPWGWGWGGPFSSIIFFFSQLTI